MTKGLRVNLTDFHLFGNSAAEDEEEDVFLAYIVERDELTAFLDKSRRICIARAYRGEGKSALLRRVVFRLESREDKPLIIHLRGNDVAPDSTSTDTDSWRRGWKRSLFQAVAREIGARIGMAWGDDAITLVEEAEHAGFKSRSVVSSIFDRLKLSAKGAKLERERLPAANHEKLVQRWSRGEDSVWLIIDDVDENFNNLAEQKAKLAGFFSAIRDVVNTVSQVRIRAAVRPTTWATLVHQHESLSKVQQYVFDMGWDHNGLMKILASRIRGYLQRSAQLENFSHRLGRSPDESDFLSVVFETPVRWGNEEKPISVPLATLARRRPRWMIELAREASLKANLARSDVIRLNHVTECLQEFGSRRLADLSSEFSVQCSQTRELVQAFSRGKEEYATDELLDFIKRKITNLAPPTIVGTATVGPTDVAAFLFQIGFLTGRRNFPDGSYEHVTYFEKPDLFLARTNRDDGLRWEIHPVYRQALNLRDAQGQVVSPENRNRTGR